MMNNNNFSDRQPRETDRNPLDMTGLDVSSIQKQPGVYEREDLSAEAFLLKSIEGGLNFN
jgi:hypothetical protein